MGRRLTGPLGRLNEGELAVLVGRVVLYTKHISKELPRLRKELKLTTSAASLAAFSVASFLSLAASFSCLSFSFFSAATRFLTSDLDSSSPFSLRHPSVSSRPLPTFREVYRNSQLTSYEGSYPPQEQLA